MKHTQVYLSPRVSGISEDLQKTRFVLQVENKVSPPHFAFKNTKAWLYVIHALTTAPVWKSGSFILCYSLVIDATLNRKRVRVSTLKTHITNETRNIVFFSLRLEYILFK